MALQLRQLPIFQ